MIYIEHNSQLDFNTMNIHAFPDTSKIQQTELYRG
jgi:hypothetical protein